jgi:hypothetical protein
MDGFAWSMDAIIQASPMDLETRFNATRCTVPTLLETKAEELRRSYQGIPCYHGILCVARDVRKSAK